MSGSIVFRAVLALLLMVGFYLLAFGIVAGLGYLVYADLSSGRIHLRLLLFAAIGVFGILYGILPRLDRFTAPGPLLSKSEFPRLHNVLETIATETRQAMPSEVSRLCFLLAERRTECIELEYACADRRWIPAVP